MNMEEFFRELEECLRGEVTEYEYADSMAYYREYFREQKAAGKSESEIIHSLGSPRLIARSIIDARGVSEEERMSGGFYDAEREEYTEREESRGTDIKRRGMDTAKGIIAIILILLLLSFVIKIFLPIALVIIVIMFVMKVIKGE